jgi:4-hydroxybenzoate polyprenyltransferase
VKSTALRFGENSWKWLTLFSATTLAGLILAGTNAGLAWPFWLGIGGAGIHLAWQVATMKIHSKEDCWKKFVSNKWFGLVVFLGYLGGILWK